MTRSAATANETTNKTSQIAADVLTRGAAEAAAVLSRSANALNNTIAASAAAANDSVGKTTHSVAELMTRSAAEASATLSRSANALNATIA